MKPKGARPRMRPGLKRTRSLRKQDRHEHTIFTKVWEGKNWRLIVAVTSYKGGKPKLLITRERAGRKYANTPFAKLGRLSKEEVVALLPILEEAVKHMK